MERYEVYKDSGIEWIGDIPASWDIRRIKDSCAVIAGATPKSDKTEYWDGGIPWITPADYDESQHYVGGGSRSITELGLNSCATTLVPKGSVIVSNRAPIGLVSIASRPLCTNQGCKAVVSLYANTSSEFLYWYLLVQTEALNNLGQGTTFLELSTHALSTFAYPCPSSREQQAIADYLDAKTTEVDALVADCEREVGLLREYRKSIITEAVTKGLDPDAPMRDSGIEWIGKIPATWRTNKLRYCGVTQNGISKGGENFGTGYPFVSYRNVYRNELDKPELFGLIESTESERARYGLKRGDILFTRTSETIEEVGIAAGTLNDIAECCFAGFLIRFRPSDDWGILPEFASYYFRSDLYRPLLTKEMVLVTRASLSQQLLGEITVLIPPDNEQLEIVRYLDAKTAEIDSLVGAKQQMADKLREYRRSLISEAVTGKFRVSGVDE